MVICTTPAGTPLTCFSLKTIKTAKCDSCTCMLQMNPLGVVHSHCEYWKLSLLENMYAWQNTKGAGVYDTLAHRLSLNQDCYYATSVNKGAPMMPLTVLGLWAKIVRRWKRVNFFYPQETFPLVPSTDSRHIRNRFEHQFSQVFSSVVWLIDWFSIHFEFLHVLNKY